MTARLLSKIKYLKNFKFCTLFFLFLFVPFVSNAAVLINEIAWMGTSVSTNDEWIELYNNGGTAVDLTGWELTDGISLSISLSGVVSSGAYFLLERTNDESVPTITADLIYTGALSNDGRTLTLYRDDGSIEDQVAGGENWEEIGGDNVSKDTAQLTSAGWITAIPTPKAQNSTTDTSEIKEGEEEDEGEDEGNEESDAGSYTPDSGGTNAKISLKGSGRVLSLELGGKRVVYVNQPVVFEATPFGVSEQLYDSLVYSWNFGDGNTGKGKEVKHAYAFPGTYVVIAEAHHATYEDESRTEVTVLPTALSLAMNNEGNILIHNNGQREIDVSQYTLRDGVSAFMFPSRTIILSRSTLTIPPKMLKKRSFRGDAALSDTAGVVVASLYGKTDGYAETEPPAIVQAQPAIEKSVPVSEDVRSVEIIEEETGSLPISTDDDSTIDSGPSGIASAMEALPQPNRNRLPFAALIGIIVLGVLALYAKRIA